MTKGICVIIPAYNEAGAIGQVIDALPRIIGIGKKQVPVTIVVVDDGSSDGTHEIIASKGHAVLVRHLTRMGAGGATRTGLRYAREHGFDFAVTCDADGQHAPKDVIKVAKYVIGGKADLVIGSRLLDISGMPRARVIGNRGLNLITFILFGVKVSDVQSGLRGFSRLALEKIHFNNSEFGFCPEMIWVATMHRLRIAEVPIKAIYTDYSLSKGQLGQTDLTAGLRVVSQLIKQRIMGLINE